MCQEKTKSNNLKSRSFFQHFSKTASNFSWLTRNRKNNFYKTHLNGYFCFLYSKYINNTNSDNVLIYLTHFESVPY